MSEHQNIREYQFHVAGFIPGVPGTWPAGSRITIDEDTKEVLSVWPEPTESVKEEHTQEQSAPTVPPAESEEKQEEQPAQHQMQ